MQGTPPKKPAKRRDQKLNILILQIITVAVIMLFAIGIRIFGGDVYSRLSLWYHEKFDDITLASDVLDPEGAADPPDSSESVSSNEGTGNGDPVEQSGKAPQNTSDEGAESGREGENADKNTEGSGLPEQLGDGDSIKTSVTVGAINNTFLWPVSGRISSEYGYRTHPISGIYSMHGGIDIAAATGTEIKSAYGGKVTETGRSDSYGYYVIITHSDNLQTLYAHCSELIADEGDIVGKGETVALVGSTGQTTGPHLHFEIRIGGSRVNPRWILGEIVSA